MKKRFTDSDIWDDPWFRKLPCAYKEFWRFICDKCDSAGVWKVDSDSAVFFIGENIDVEKATELFNNGKKRVQILDNGRWFVSGFIFFQYGNLSPACRPHAHVRATFLKHKIKGYVKGIDTLEEEEEDKDKDKEQEKVIGELHKDKDIILIVPDWIPVDAWQDYISMRKSIKKPMTERAKELAIAELIKLKEQGNDPKQVLEQSIFKSWIGLFPLNSGGMGYGKKPVSGCAAPIPGKYSHLGEKE